MKREAKLSRETKGGDGGEREREEIAGHRGKADYALSTLYTCMTMVLCDPPQSHVKILREYFSNREVQVEEGKNSTQRKKPGRIFKSVVF